MASSLPSSSSHDQGRFYLAPDGIPRFAGAASSVYIADTAQSYASQESHLNRGDPQQTPALQSKVAEASTEEAALYSGFSLHAADLLVPGVRNALEVYFEIWHPLFPFLDGAYVLSAFETAVERAGRAFVRGPSAANANAFTLSPAEALVLSAILKSVVAIGDNDGSVARSGFPRLTTASQATMLGHLVLSACQEGSVNDLFAIQALIALTLFLYVSRKFRPAMHMIELAFEAGLHRCPDQYRSTFPSQTDREMRKRVFWSMYTLDRLLTAEFGIPTMLHDADIDTCVPGAVERHPLCASSSTVDSTPVGDRQEDSDDRRKRRRITPPSPQPHVAPNPDQLPPVMSPRHALDPQRRRLLPAFSLVGISQLIGQSMDIVTREVCSRSKELSKPFQLRLELDRWWSDIGLSSDVEVDQTEGVSIDDDARRPYSTLFHCLYHDQIIALSRPALSRAPGSPEHAAALDICVASAHALLRTLAKEFDGPDSRKTKRCANCPLGGFRSPKLMWPGYVDSAFLAALVLVYASKRTESSNAALRRGMRVLESLQTNWSVDSFLTIVRNFLEYHHGGEQASTLPAAEMFELFLFDVGAKDSLPGFLEATLQSS